MGIVKVCLVGDAETGKTSLINRYINKVPFSEDYQMTTCATFALKEDVQVWDIAGDVRFQSIASAYVKNSHAVVICVDMTNRQSFENIQKWVDLVSRQGKENFIYVLAGTKSDLGEKQQVTPEELQARAEALKFAYIITSAKTGANIEELFTTIILPVLSQKADDHDVFLNYPSPLGRDDSKQSLLEPFEDSADAVRPASRCRPGCCTIL